MPASSLIKIVLLIPFLIAGGLAIAMLSYIMVPMMVAGAIFSVLYVITVDLQRE